MHEFPGVSEQKCSESELQIKNSRKVSIKKI